jgi:hypothetical protein
MNTIKFPEVTPNAVTLSSREFEYRGLTFIAENIAYVCEQGSVLLNYEFVHHTPDGEALYVHAEAYDDDFHDAVNDNFFGNEPLSEVFYKRVAHYLDELIDDCDLPAKEAA